MYFKCREKYKLILSWESVEYKSDSLAFLARPKFSGPALTIAARITDNDSIDLDITSQHVLLINSWDIVKFSWGRVITQDCKEVVFDHGTLTSPEATKVRLFKDSDRLLIDTENHEDEKHALNFVYRCVVSTDDCAVYDYKQKFSDKIG